MHPREPALTADRWGALCGVIALLLSAAVGGFATQLFGFATDACFGECDDTLIATGLLLGPLGIVVTVIATILLLVWRLRPGRRVAWIPWTGVGAVLLVVLISYGLVSAGTTPRG
ncbi:hypothetical protein C5D18_15035 [Rathayibacter tritici]|nr:hypothetical protein C5D18_15035 [Rathayibacter tritici]